MAKDIESGRIIREAREDNHWSRAALAKKSGIDERRIETIERHGVVTPRELQAILKALPTLRLSDLGLVEPQTGAASS